MAIKIEINTVSRSAVYALLPSDWQKRVSEILKEQGHAFHPNTLTNTFKTGAKITPAREQVIKAAIRYLEELKERRQAAVSVELARDIEEYRATGS